MAAKAERGNPKIIQGGMGVGVSGWMLARAVSKRGHLGVVSGTGLDQMFVRRLQTGDAGGHLRRAIAQFPSAKIASMVIDKYYIAGGKDPDAPFRTPGMMGLSPPPDLVATVVLANFVEVWLAKEGHDGVVGLNLLDKIQMPNLASLYGGMLAGLDYVLMGAGIPWQIPGLMDRLARSEVATMRVTLEDDPQNVGAEVVFDPATVLENPPAELRRPRFLAIISATPVAQALLKRAVGKIDGFVVEGATAGGHNAPPRGPMKLTDDGEPIYGERDVADLEKLKTLNHPFWLAGGMGRPGQLAKALALGAEGIQVGTAFAFCEESGITSDLRERTLAGVLRGDAKVLTDPNASPTGYPFKVVQLDGTCSDIDVYDARDRVCDAGYLRHPYLKADGTVGYRCPGEPIDLFEKKGGALGDAIGRKCLCNGLLATTGLGQSRQGGAYMEPPILTAGDDLALIKEYLTDGKTCYSADDVIDRLTAELVMA